MKNTILALAIAAGLTSFAGNVKADAYTPNINVDTTLGAAGSPSDPQYRGAAVITAPNASTFNNLQAYSEIKINFLNTSAFSELVDIYLTDIDGNQGSNEYLVNADSTALIDLTVNYYNTPLSTLYLGLNTRDISYGVPSGTTYKIGSSSTVVPEPSTYALFGIGALALIVAYRRRNGCVATVGSAKVA